MRSLHRETIAIIVEFEQWWQGMYRNTMGLFGPAVLKGAGEELSGKDLRAAALAEERWRHEIHPRLSVLITGHPDPAVREAADVLDKRSFHPIVVLHRPGVPSEARQQENSLSIKLIHDGLTELRRAAYYAPFRIHRPEPDWDGVPTGNAEGLPGDIFKRMKERGEHWKG